MTIQLTYEEAKSLLERAVSERGESYVYQKVSTGGQFPYDTCAYFNPATQAPSCIVGHILAYKGATCDAARLGNWNAGVNVEELVRNGIIECNEETAELLDIVQLHQDSGIPWGRAVELAFAGEDDEHNIS